jgi:hypothetical protein
MANEATSERKPGEEIGTVGTSAVALYKKKTDMHSSLVDTHFLLA